MLSYFHFLATPLLMMAILLSVERWYFVLFQTGGLHDDEISSAIHLITSRELTSES